MVPVVGILDICLFNPRLDSDADGSSTMQLLSSFSYAVQKVSFNSVKERAGRKRMTVLSETYSIV